LVLTLALRGCPTHPMSAPSVKSLQTTFSSGCVPQSSWIASCLNFVGQTKDLASIVGLLGNFPQKSELAGLV
jgi:hypothetical protein